MPSLARTVRVAALLLLAFCLGGAATEVTLRTHDAVARARAEREIGSAGQLVSLELTGVDGEPIARPRVIAPAGRAAELVLRDPLRPDEVRLVARLEAERDPTGDIALRYTLRLPAHGLDVEGTLALEPGVEQSIRLGDGSIVATWLAVPVPSAAFDAWIEAEREGRTSFGRRWRA